MLSKVLAAMVTTGFLAMTAFEVHHDLVRREPWPGYALVAGNVVFVLAPFWLAGAITVWTKETWGWLGVIAGCFAAAAHGIGVRVGGSPVGIAFFAAAVVLLLLTALSRRAGRANARLARRGSPGGRAKMTTSRAERS